jgi:peptidoglycan L-alanyl-D-glutamate endopeptidase CwlK
MDTGYDRSDCMITLMSSGIQSKIKAVIKELRDANWQAVVHESRRDKAQQEKKCRDGRSTTMCSKHMCDNAADIIDKRYAWGSGCKAEYAAECAKVATGNHAFWTALGAAAKKQGLEWGGDWTRFRDVAHVQSGSCTLSQLRPYGVTSCDCPK